MSGPHDQAGGAALAQAAALLAAGTVGGGAGGSAGGNGGAGQAGPGVQRHVSVQHALYAWGVPAAQAQAMALDARRAGCDLVRLTLPPSATRPGGGELFVRRMPGNHAEAWVVPAGAAAPPKENNR